MNADVVSSYCEKQFSSWGNDKTRIQSDVEKRVKELLAEMEAETGAKWTEKHEVTFSDIGSRFKAEVTVIMQREI